MSQVIIDFEWQRDPGGYRLRDAVPEDLDDNLVPYPLGIRVLAQRDMRHKVVRLGRKLTSYRPLEKFNVLFKVFANIRTTMQVVEFIENFGPLTRDGLDRDRGESVAFVLAHSEGMREVLTYTSGDGKRQRKLIDRQVAPFSQVDVTLILDPATKRPRLRLSPSTLLDALWLQLGQELSSGASIRNCQQCGEWFEVGIGSGRRLDARFCTDAHRVMFNSLKRSK